MLPSSITPWGPGWYSNKVRFKVKLGRWPTDQGPIQEGLCPSMGTGMRELRAGNPTTCVCVLQQGLMALAGAGGAGPMDRGGGPGETGWGRWQLAVPSGSLHLIQVENTRHLQVTAVKQGLPLPWSKPAPGHSYCKGFLCCVCVCQIITHYENMKVPSWSSSSDTAFPKSCGFQGKARLVQFQHCFAHR